MKFRHKSCLDDGFHTYHPLERFFPTFKYNDHELVVFGFDRDAVNAENFKKYVVNPMKRGDFHPKAQILNKSPGDFCHNYGQPMHRLQWCGYGENCEYWQRQQYDNALKASNEAGTELPPLPLGFSATYCS